MKREVQFLNYIQTCKMMKSLGCGKLYIDDRTYKGLTKIIHKDQNKPKSSIKKERIMKRTEINKVATQNYRKNN